MYKPNVLDFESDARNFDNCYVCHLGVGSSIDFDLLVLCIPAIKALLQAK